MKCAIILRDGRAIVMGDHNWRQIEVHDNGALTVSTDAREVTFAPGAWLRYDTDVDACCGEIAPIPAPSPNHPARADLDAPPSS